MEYFLQNVEGLYGNSICNNAKAQKCEWYDCFAGDHVIFRELKPIFIQKFYILFPTAVSSTFSKAFTLPLRKFVHLTEKEKRTEWQ